MRADKKSHLKPDKKTAARSPRGHVGYSKKTALLEEAITQMNAGKYGRSSAALKELLNLDPHNMEARRLFATLHLRLGSLIPARQAFDALIQEALERQDFWLAESLLREYLAAGPRCVPFLEKLGNLFEEKGNTLEAVTEYGKAIDILLEDPDPEHPQRPSQLYAKIRDLAPASPVAFRLASFFDAQTGELVAGTTLPSAEAPAADEPVGSTPVAAEGSSSEAMLRDPADELPAHSSVKRASDPLTLASSTDMAAGTNPEIAGSKTDTHAGAAPVSSFGSGLEEAVTVPCEPPLGEPNLPSVAGTAVATNDRSIPHAESIVVFSTATTPVLEAASVGERHPVPADDPAKVEQLSQRTDSVPGPIPSEQVEHTTIDIVEPVPDSASVPNQSSADLELLAEPAPSAESNPVSAPMPWEQVERTTIDIVEPVPESASVPNQSGADLESLGEPTPSAESNPVSAPMPWEQVERTTIDIVEPVPESASVPNQSGADLESLGEPTPSDNSLVPAPMGEPAPAAESNPVSAPMPWEQVEHTTIDIVDSVPESASVPNQSSADLESQGEPAPAAESNPLSEAMPTEVVHRTIDMAVPVSEVDPPLAQAFNEPEPLSQPEQPTENNPVTVHVNDPQLEAPIHPASAEPEERMPETPIRTATETLSGASDSEIETKPAEPAADVSQPAATPGPSDPCRDQPKHGGFSWQSISRAWKFGKTAPVEEPKEGSIQSHGFPAKEVCDRTESAVQPVMATPAFLKNPEEPASPAVTIEVAPDQPFAEQQIKDFETVQDVAAFMEASEPPQPHGEEPPSISMPAPASEGDSLQPSGGDMETAVSSLTDPAAVSETAEYEFRLQVVDATPTSNTDAPPVSAILAGDDSSVVDTAAEAYEPERVEPGLLGKTGRSLFHWEASDQQKQEAPSPLTFDSAAAPNLTPSASPAREPTFQTEQPTIQPSHAPDDATDIPSAVGVNGAAPAMTHHDPSVGLQEGKAISVSASPSSDQQADVDVLDTVSSSERSAEAPASPPAYIGDLSHWQTGEVAVQVHRPTSNKRQDAASAGGQRSKDLPDSWSAVDQSMGDAGAAAGAATAESLTDNDEWIRTGASIRFTEPQRCMRQPAAPSVVPDDAPDAAPVSDAEAAVEMLFASSTYDPATTIREQVAEPKPGRRRVRAKLARARIAISIFITSCFSTTSAMLISVLALVLFAGALTAAGVGAVALTWMMLEESPSSAFRAFTTAPGRTLSDFKQNGYVLLLGFDAPPGQDPLQFGHKQKMDTKDAAMVAACIGGPNGDGRGGHLQGSASVADGLFRARDPVAAFTSRADTVKGWADNNERALARYAQWLRLSFDDWGYGESATPPCHSIAFAHQVYVAQGVLLGTEAGIDRLEADMEAWRTALARARSLPVKAMALRAVRDDAAVASAFLMRPESDGKTLGRLTKMVRPLDHGELSMRWAMQSELVWAAAHFDAQLKAEREEDLPVYAATAALLPLPKQRRLNRYAEYLEASSKAAEDGPYSVMPERNRYIHAPADSLIDYWRDPIENLIGLEPLPEWHRYSGLLGDLDAQFRLVRLQAWLRRGPQDADLAARIAKAGQDLYDPYTGFPMLINRKKGALYSVGHDRRDRDADSETDIVVGIPLRESPAALADVASSPKSP